MRTTMPEAAGRGRAVAMPGGRLAGATVPQLELAEQFVLWAFRQRLADDGPGSDRLAAGFRLALGLAALEPGLAAFERVFATVHAHARRDLHLAPLRCACVSRDEAALLGIVASAQAGDGALTSMAGALLAGGGEAADSLAAGAGALARLLAQADLRLPRRPVGAAAAWLH